MSRSIGATAVIHYQRPHWAVQVSKSLGLATSGIGFRWLIGRLWTGPAPSSQGAELAERTVQPIYTLLPYRISDSLSCFSNITNRRQSEPLFANWESPK